MNNIKITFQALIRLLFDLSGGKKEISVIQCLGNSHRVWLCYEDSVEGILNYDFDQQKAFGMTEETKKILEITLNKDKEIENPFVE